MKDLSKFFACFAGAAVLALSAVPPAQALWVAEAGFPLVCRGRAVSPFTPPLVLPRRCR